MVRKLVTRKTLLTEALVAVLLLSLFINPTVQALDDMLFKVYPESGNANTDITVVLNIYGGPGITLTEPTWVTIVWDDKIMISRIICPLAGTLYRRYWILVFRFPLEGKYCTLGEHKVTGFIEHANGKIDFLPSLKFRVTELIPPDNWWSGLDSAFLRSLTGSEGPIGPKGDTGRTGSDGRRGLKGEGGDDGEDGVDGALGPVGPPGEAMPGPQGTAGDPGVKGETGDTGPAGEGVDMMVLYAVVGAVFVSLLLSLNNTLTIRSARKAANTVVA